MKTTTFHPLAAMLLAMAASAASAQTTVKDAWVRGTVPQQQASGAFMQITSAQGGRLVAVSTPVAGVAEIHEMKMDGGVMKMAPVAGGLVLPAGKPVELKPGGYHLMLMGLKQQLKGGDNVPLSLTVEGPDGKKETLDLSVPVRALGQ
ncbi:MAG: copper chaperone PCu(A)C [Burkholderiaceae bacterium]